MRTTRTVNAPAATVFLVLFLFLCIPASSLAGDRGKNNENESERLYNLYFSYPEIIIDEGTTSVNVDLIVSNPGTQVESLFFTFSDIPDGWDVRATTYVFGISAIRISEGDQRMITVTVEPAIDAAPGTYRIGIDSRTKDGTLSRSDSLSVTIREKEEARGAVELTTSYPVLQGPSDVTFEFSLSIANKTRQEQVFSLLSDPPRDWQVNFKPSFQDKYVSSMILKADESKSVNVEVVPARGAQAGEHTIPITVAAGDIVEETALKVTITGTYSLRLGTPTGLLSLEAERGKPVTFSIFVRNTGTASIREISLMSVKPENWEVAFDPATIESLRPGGTRQVEMTITPADQALVGDYALGVSALGERSADDLELRVTVKASAAWGWIGIGIILFVIAGLVVLFVTLGRR